MSKIRRKRRKKKVEKVRFERPQINLSTHAIKMIIIAIAIIMLLGCAFAYFVKKYTVDTIIVEGSTHYTTEEINKMEKAVAGYVEYMGQYIYFDKDGTVVESSDIRTEGIPQIMGMKFDHVVLWEKLPVSDEEIFKNILDVSQLLEKYEIKVDKIYFDDDYNVTLYFDQARVKLGSFDNIDEKIIRLKAILPELKGRKGVLKLQNYTVETGYASFEEDE